MYGKASRVAAKIQHLTPGAVGPDPSTVFLLVKKMAGFLPMGNIHQHRRVVLPDLHQLWHLAVDAAAEQGKTFFFPYGDVVSLVNADRMEELRKNVDQIRLKAFQAQAHDLKAEILAKLVHRQTRQPIGLTEDHPAGIFKTERLAIAPCVADPTREEFPIDRFVRVFGQNTHRDLGACVEKALADKAQMAVKHLRHVAVLECVVHPVDLVVIDPQGAAGKIQFLAPAQTDLARHQAFRVWMKCQESRHMSSTVRSACQPRTSWARSALA